MKNEKRKKDARSEHTDQIKGNKSFSLQCIHYHKNNRKDFKRCVKKHFLKEYEFTEQNYIETIIVIIRNEEKSKMQRLYPIAGVFERDLKKDIMKNVLYSIGK